MLKGIPLWPGRSDLDQLYLIIKTLGELLPRHKEIFQENSFFRAASKYLSPSIRSRSRQKSWQFLQFCFKMDPVQRATCEDLKRFDYFDRSMYSDVYRDEDAGRRRMKALDMKQRAQQVSPLSMKGQTANAPPSGMWSRAAGARQESRGRAEGRESLAVDEEISLARLPNWGRASLSLAPGLRLSSTPPFHSGSIHLSDSTLRASAARSFASSFGRRAGGEGRVGSRESSEAILSENVKSKTRTLSTQLQAPLSKQRRWILQEMDFEAAAGGSSRCRHALPAAAAEAH
uniref:Protein kinase domain-containing protein n=1 Tax=Macrostomum lignano TaxID=282301 RepID=A0A1I8FHB6_9PLAT